MVTVVNIQVNAKRFIDQRTLQLSKNVSFFKERFIAHGIHFKCDDCHKRHFIGVLGEGNSIS